MSTTATPVTIHAAEMVRLSGVGRERLRTWERRHDFPKPARCRNNVRRYLADDVPRVIVVSRLVEQGVPLAEAIEQANAIASVPCEIDSLGAVLDHAPVPVIALAGGESLQVVWANGAARARAIPPTPGESAMEALPELDHDAWQQLRRLVSGASAGAEVLGERITGRRWLAWRAPQEAGNAPTIVLMHVVAGELPPPMLANPAGDAQRDDQWVSAVRAARQALRTERGPAAAQRALSTLARELRAIDAFLATCNGRTLRSATSVRGSVAPVTLALLPEVHVWRTIASGEADWLGPSCREYLGVSPHLQVLCIPIMVGAAPCGAAFVITDAVSELGPSTRELLALFGGSLGAALLHVDRRVGGLPQPC